MEVVVFKDKKWSEMPTQDNPAFDYVSDNPNLGRNSACIVICKSEDYQMTDGYIVLKVPLQGEVKRLGLFWELKWASRFANTYVRIHNLKGE